MWADNHLGVAFDRSFSRIGYGKGYYDKFLNAYSEKQPSRSPYLGKKNAFTFGHIFLTHWVKPLFV
jgi:5-formyltetrahydrofolate cyclo-ligase